MDLKTRIESLSRVGKTTAARLKKINISTVEDLLFHFPFRYEDYSQIKKIAELRPGEPMTVRVKIQLIANRRARRRRLTVSEALVADDSGSLQVVWFNQPFITKNLKSGDEVFLSGMLDANKMQLVSPEYEKTARPVNSARSANTVNTVNSARSARSVNTVNTARLGNSGNVHTGIIVPVYHLTEGITQKQVRFLMKQALPAVAEVVEYLPADLRTRQDFLIINQALAQIHFPESAAAARAARRRLAFDEMFLIQLAIQLRRKELQADKAFALAFLEKQTKDFVASLPFVLTAAQKKCAWEILQDLAKEKPMNRLLEGDVGSGKTVVLAIALLNVILNGYKAMVMAPTEILAVQHYHSLRKLFAKQNFDIALMTGAKRELNGEKLSKAALLAKLAEGEVELVIGTHAVIQENVKFKDLGFVAVDEQHRFGVAQRKALLARGGKQLMPHFLSMTATPIPRSLVLTLYGDLDLSIINQLPLGRKPIITKVIYESERDRAYSFIREQVKDGRQAFVICPLIDPSDTLGYKSAKLEYERLSRDIFHDLRVALMHGRLKSKEKEQVMRDFYEKKYDLLVSTSVIEVGIDVPNATMMIIEGADRFGLAQLHQFRGRVGRGEHQSHCLLFTGNYAPDSLRRLQFMETCRDGFKLAEKDLELRGPGEVYGTRQSGLPDLQIANLADVNLINTAQTEARALVESEAVSPELTAALEKVKVSLHFE